MIRTILVEDNIYIQKHFSTMLSSDGRFEISGVFRDAFEAERLCEQTEVDLVLMDVQTLKNHSGLAAGARIRRACPHTKVIIITSLIDPDVLDKAMHGCADSLWYKDHSDADILSVIERTLDGQSVFPDASPTIDMNGVSSNKISPRQLEILRRFIMGMTYDEIAADMGMTKNGVRWNLDKIVDVFGYNNKHELLAAAIENRLIVTTLREEN